MSSQKKYKQCGSCRKVKQLTGFYRDRCTKDGFMCYCTVCSSARAKVTHLKYHSRNIARCRKYYAFNREVLSVSSSTYHKTHRDSINKKNRQRYYEDEGYRILSVLRTRAYQALKGINKSSKTLTLIGCDVQQLKQYVERLWKAGMNWDNYGMYNVNIKTWNIDHIEACSTFELTDPVEQAICFHFSNIRPMWAEENLMKGAKAA